MFASRIHTVTKNALNWKRAKKELQVGLRQAMPGCSPLLILMLPYKLLQVVVVDACAVQVNGADLCGQLLWASESDVTLPILTSKKKPHSLNIPKPTSVLWINDLNWYHVCSYDTTAAMSIQQCFVETFLPISVWELRRRLPQVQRLSLLAVSFEVCETFRFIL